MSGLDPLLTAEQAQAILGVSRWWLDHHAAELGAVKVGKFLRFRQKSLDAYLDRQTVKPPTPEFDPVSFRKRQIAAIGQRTSNLDPATLRPRKEASR